MKNTQKKRVGGFTLVEILLAVSLFAGVLLLGGKSLLQITQQSRILNEKLELESQTFALSRHLLRVIRFAESCTSTQETMNVVLTPPVVATPGNIECDIIMQTPRLPSSVATKVRFVHNGTQVDFQTEAGGGFVNTLSYPRISRFLICNDADMAADCPIGSSHADIPNKINAVHNENLNAPLDRRTSENHFFHYLISAELPATLETGGNNLAQGTTVSLQGAAFMLNNPVKMVGLAAVNPLSFESGGKILE